MEFHYPKWFMARDSDKRQLFWMKADKSIMHEYVWLIKKLIECFNLLLNIINSVWEIQFSQGPSHCEVVNCVITSTKWAKQTKKKQQQKNWYLKNVRKVDSDLSAYTEKHIRVYIRVQMRQWSKKNRFSGIKPSPNSQWAKSKNCYHMQSSHSFIINHTTV